MTAVVNDEWIVIALVSASIEHFHVCLCTSTIYCYDDRRAPAPRKPAMCSRSVARASCAVPPSRRASTVASRAPPRSVERSLNPKFFKSSFAISSFDMRHSKYALDSVVHLSASDAFARRQSRYDFFSRSHSWKWSRGNTPFSGASDGAFLNAGVDMRRRVTVCGKSFDGCRLGVADVTDTRARARKGCCRPRRRAREATRTLRAPRDDPRPRRRRREGYSASRYR